MDLNLKNKVVAVTGGAGLRGSIGTTLVYALASEGAIPVIIDKSDRGLEYQRELEARGSNACFIKTDLTDFKAVEAAAAEIGKAYGKLDGLINNLGSNDGVGLGASVDEFMSSLRLNLISLFAVTKFCLPYLKKARGNILNIGSKVALTGQGGTSGYAASKGGVLGLTREWAVDLLKEGIRSNAIIISESWTPSYESWIASLDKGTEKLKNIQKNIPFENRMTTPREIADICLFTISERASHTTGQFIFVDGGYVHLDRALLTNI